MPYHTKSKKKSKKTSIVPGGGVYLPGGSIYLPGGGMNLPGGGVMYKAKRKRKRIKK